jgi:hypothetical protein
LFHKYEILEPLCGSKPKEGVVLDERSGKEIKRWYFNTLVESSLIFFGNLFYKYDPVQEKWIKNVPLKVQTFLTPRALAYFYMDDGSLKWLGHSNAMRLCTESFSIESIQRIQASLKNLYNLETTLTKKPLNGSVGRWIAISEKSSGAFRELIKPYLVDCMKYKVLDGNKNHL